MAIYGASSSASFLFKISGSTADMPVVSFSAVEWISLSFALSVTVATVDEIISFDEIIGKESLLTIVNSDLLSGIGDRYFHGLISRFEHIGMSGRKFLYEAEVVPTIFLLSLRRNCRIFQETTTQDIVKSLLEEAGITSNRFRFALVNTDRKRGFCVQYQETDLEFVSRLIEEEGIYYFFEHYMEKHVLVFSDNLSVHVPIHGAPSITCNSGGGLIAEKESVSHFSFSQRQTSEAFAHSNFSFKKPGLDLTIEKTDSKKPQYEVYEYAALHTTQARGDALANVRREQLVALQKQGQGQSSSSRLTPGYKVTLTDHHSKSLNAEYLIIDVSHTGSQPQTLEENSSGSASYDNQFTVIPAKTQYRPTIKTVKPTVKGLQTAIVVGPRGEEIHTDEHGRVKVQFHWDRLGKNDDKSSCWLRVSQTWGGGAWGSQFIPRIGEEVLVDFLEGNPDRPIITGSVYNGDNLPINSLNKSITQSGIRTKTHKGEGFHELRFDDANGSEEIYLQSQKDWNILIKNDKGQSVGHDEALKVGNNRLKIVGVDQMEQVGRNQTEIIGANQSISIGSNKSETVTINSAENVGVAKELSIGGLYQVSVGAAMNETVIGAKTEEVGITKAVLVGAHMTETVLGNRSLTVGENLSATVKQSTLLKAKSIILEADDEIILKSGRATISLKSNGEIVVSGATFTVQASGEIVIKGAKTSAN
jgi:type VI secretion system secreted protein VgrG